MAIKPFAAGILATLALTTQPSFADNKAGFKQKGVASHYADRFQGRKTASGERYDRRALTAAHRTLPLGTVVKVTNVKSGDTVEVEINDRGPFIKGRVLDLSRAAAEELGMIGPGLVRVELVVVAANDDA
jgi:rare lipoprotein A